MSVFFMEADIRNEKIMSKLFFEERPIKTVIHSAETGKRGTKHFGNYFSNNIMATKSLLKVMNFFHCWEIIYTSSAHAYGPPDESEHRYLSESQICDPKEDYGQSKVHAE